MRIAAIVLCAGSSVRFGEDKMWLRLGGETVWQRSVRIFTQHPQVTDIVVVCSQARESEFRALLEEGTNLVVGGENRVESTQNGLAAVPDACEIVLVHDGARPFVSAELIDAVIQATVERGAAAPVLPCRDTIRLILEGAAYDLDRAALRSYQTPQGARRELLAAALEVSTGEETDDVALLQNVGVTVSLVPGSEGNWKITHRDDLRQIPMELRTGLGYDIHSFSEDPNRPLWLGGIEFDDRPGLEGHSDADVLLHAIADALLGAANLGDIGVHFPNSDERWRNQPSSYFLEVISQLLLQNHWEIVNIDSTVVAERPKVMKRRDEICSTVARSLGIAAEKISVKATTNEKLGAIGRAEGVAAFATATIRRLAPE